MTNKKELNIEELENVNGGVFTDLNEADRAQFVGKHVEVYYKKFGRERSHGGTITDAKIGHNYQNGKVLVHVQFDGWSYHGWYWWEDICNNYVFPNEDMARGWDYEYISVFDDITM